MDFKNVDPNGENVSKRNSKSMQFFFIKNVKIELANKVQSFFFMPLVLVKLHFHIFHLLIGMEWTKASLEGMDLSNMVWCIFYFYLKYLKNFFVLPALPSNEKNSFDHHNSTNKYPNLVFFSFTKSPSNSLLIIKFPKNNITSSYHSNLSKTAKAIFWPQRT